MGITYLDFKVHLDLGGIIVTWCNYPRQRFQPPKK